MTFNHNNEELEAKQLRNEQLRSELTRLEQEVSEMERQQEIAEKKLLQLKEQYDTFKNSPPWRFLRKVKRVTKVSTHYLTGKKNIKLLWNPSLRKKQAGPKINKIKYRLYNLGFTKKARQELEKIIETSENKELKMLAAWELALWYANQYSQEGALKALKLLSVYKKGEKNKNALRKIAIIEAECYELVGMLEQGRAVIASALAKDDHPDLYLAGANLEPSLKKRVQWINKVLDSYGLSNISLADIDATGNIEASAPEALSEFKSENEQGPTQMPYDRLQGSISGSNSMIAPSIDSNKPKVTVIIPVYNAKDFVHISIESMLNQTWKNLEIIVVDDCSTDNTVELIEGYVQKDSRVKLLTTKVNGGPYIARNLALATATGEYVTINDADDWSHPEKIEIQVNHLLEHPNVMANTSVQARATEELKFYRRGKPGSYLFSNMSSLMFRREPVLEAIGYWDEVRFGADGEFKRRLKLVFGDESVVDLKTGPLSFQRQSSQSLTGNSVFGYHGYFMGARQEYFDGYTYYHKTANSLKYPMGQKNRLFPVPEPMWPEREAKSFANRHFDVIIASEFRLLGGTNMSNVEEIKAQKRMGLRTGLIQMARYDFDSEKQINPRIRQLIDGDQVQMLVYGEKISCDLLIVRHPPILQEWQKYIPNVKARAVKVIINQPPKRDYSKNGKKLYDLKQCALNLNDYFGKKGKWYPIGPLIRDTLYNHHNKELQSIKLATEDWVNIIDVNEWRRTSQPKRTNKIVIGRHSRSQYVKWPIDKNQLLTIYPDTEPYEIHVLGGADAPRKVLGEIPTNWTVYEFGEREPKEFLACLDVFVYYTHPDWIESFGRVILEAMAVGVPVIIPPVYQNLFGDAAIYAEPNEVQAKIQELMNDDKRYQAQVAVAQAFVENQFGYSKHASRLRPHLVPSHHN